MKKLKKTALVAGIVCLVALLCALAGLVYLRQEERGSTAYLACKGHVAPDYESVREYLLTEFPLGLPRDDVLQKLRRSFRHKLVGRAAARPLYIVFPGRLCDDEALNASPSSCRYLIGYQFDFVDDLLTNMSACDPPCEQW